MDALTHNYVRVAQTRDLKAKGYLVVRAEGQTIALFHHNDRIYAVDNRCPHMGFPLHQGSVSNCILTCHWHHARFDLESGGTFDPWADDVRSFPVQIRAGEVWLDLTDHLDAKTHARQRLIDGLEQSISLIIAKSVLALLAQRIDPTEVFQVGLDFGIRYRNRGWGSGLTMHTCMMNLLPYLDERDRPRALYHGLAAVAAECAGKPPRFEQQPLPLSGQTGDKLPLHSFTFANAVESGLRRVPSPLLLRGVFDAAMTVYLNRFLNVPPARLPEPGAAIAQPEEILEQLPELLDRQQQVDQAGKLVARYLYSGGDPDRLLAMLGKLLLREDRDFHTIQEIEAAFRQYARLRETKAGIHVLVAATRYLAAHAPTRRSQGQTYEMAEKLDQGERVFEAS